MTEGLLAGWLKDVISDEIVIDPDDINKEGNSNLWGFSFSDEGIRMQGLTLQEAKDFSQEVVRARKAQRAALRLPAGSLIFYCWVDFLIGQLRFSLVSAGHGRLPFGARLQAVDDVEVILKSWLKIYLLPAIPPEDDSEEEEAEDGEWTVEVWSTPV